MSDSGVRRRTAQFQTLDPGPTVTQTNGPNGVLLRAGYIGAAGAIAANDLHAVKWVPDAAAEVASIGYFLTTVDAADPPAYAALYKKLPGTGGLTQVAISAATTGAVTAPGNYWKFISLTAPYLVTAGDVYYAAVAFSGAVQVIRRYGTTIAQEGNFWGTPGSWFISEGVGHGIAAASYPPPLTIADSAVLAVSAAVAELVIRFDTDFADSY